MIKTRARGEKGASAVEYGLLLVAGVAALIVAVMFAFGGIINDPHADWVLVFKSEATDETPAITVMMRCKGDRAFYVSLANGSVSHSTESGAVECT